MHSTWSVRSSSFLRHIRAVLFFGTALFLGVNHSVSAHPQATPPTIALQAGLAGTPDDAWDDRFGAPGVTCCVGFDDVVNVAQTAGNDVYVAGVFAEIGNLPGTSAVARWDGRRWHALGSGLRATNASGDTSGDVYGMAISGNDVYVVGNFDRAGGVPVANIARWSISTQTWSAIGNDSGPLDDFDSPTALSAVAVVDNQIFVGGDFRSIGGVEAEGIAVWNGTQWSPLAGGVADTDQDEPQVNAILARGDQVFVGGAFDLAVNPNGVADANANNIAVWTRSTNRWAALGTGTSAPVDTLAADGGSLFAGGSFVRAGGKVVNAVARWDGTQWNPLGSGVNGVVYGLSASNGSVYVAGSFANASGVANTDSLALWNGTQWSSLRTDQLLNDPEEQYINTAVAFPGGVFAAGSFNDSGQPLFRSVAIWDGGRWRGTGQGLTDGYVNPGDGYAVAVTNQGQAFVGGRFAEIGGIAFRNLALWDGNEWRDVGGGVDGTVSALLIRGEDLYVGGKFLTVGSGVAAVNVARWNLRTQTWSAVGNGLPDGFVLDMVFVGNTLYAGGGGFPSQTECCLWKWDGNAWSPFSQKFLTDYFAGPFGGETTVLALATDGQQLFVGGKFLDITFRANTNDVRFANDIFIYNPADDSISLFGPGAAVNDGTGVDGKAPVYVSAITVADGALYIGGSFESIQKVAAVNIARSNANGWSALGTGAVGEDAHVDALVANGTDLYVGGAFEVAGQQAFNIARWNTRSQQWSPLGCGIVRYDNSLSANGVEALAVQPLGSPNAGLYAAGGFLDAGCKAAEGFAIWRDFGAGPLGPRAYLPLLRR